MIPQNTHQTNAAIAAIIHRTSRAEKRTLLDWLEELIGIRNSGLSKREKIKRILLSLRHSANLLGLVRPLWENSSKRIKIGVGVLLGTAVFFPGSIGFAIAGTGIAVPLWVLSTSGYFVISTLAEELRNALNEPTPREVIDADYTVVKSEDIDQR